MATTEMSYRVSREPKVGHGDEETFKSPSDGAALSKTITRACEALRDRDVHPGTFTLYRVERVEDELLATLVLSDRELTIEAAI